ncbi:hypothetical protein ACSEN3_29795 [Pseudomonas aeruginosa]|uniref:hypothetical protein n=1 Tax=Pseudomonas aeruginosa TaxID=287 RepID=UPI003BF00A28
MLVKRSRTMPVTISTLPLITAPLSLPFASAVVVTICAVSRRTAVTCRLAERSGAPGVRKVMLVTLKPALVVRQASSVTVGAAPEP